MFGRDSFDCVWERESFSGVNSLSEHISDSLKYDSRKFWNKELKIVINVSVRDTSKKAYRQKNKINITLPPNVYVFGLMKFLCCNHRLPIAADQQQNLPREDKNIWSVISLLLDMTFIFFLNVLRLLIIIQNLFLENFFNHPQRITSIDLCPPQRKKNISAVSKFAREAKMTQHQTSALDRYCCMNILLVQSIISHFY